MFDNKDLTKVEEIIFNAIQWGLTSAVIKGINLPMLGWLMHSGFDLPEQCPMIKGAIRKRYGQTRFDYKLDSAAVREEHLFITLNRTEINTLQEQKVETSGMRLINLTLNVDSRENSPFASVPIDAEVTVDETLFSMCHDDTHIADFPFLSDLEALVITHLSLTHPKLSRRVKDFMDVYVAKNKLRFVANTAQYSWQVTSGNNKWQAMAIWMAMIDRSMGDTVSPFVEKIIAYLKMNLTEARTLNDKRQWEEILKLLSLEPTTNQSDKNPTTPETLNFPHKRYDLLDSTRPITFITADDQGAPHLELEGVSKLLNRKEVITLGATTLVWLFNNDLLGGLQDLISSSCRAILKKHSQSDNIRTYSIGADEEGTLEIIGAGNTGGKLWLTIKDENGFICHTTSKLSGSSGRWLDKSTMDALLHFISTDAVIEHTTENLKVNEGTSPTSLLVSLAFQDTNLLVTKKEVERNPHFSPEQLLILKYSNFSALRLASESNVVLDPCPQTTYTTKHHADIRLKRFMEHITNRGLISDGRVDCVNLESDEFVWMSAKYDTEFGAWTHKEVEPISIVLFYYLNKNVGLLKKVEDNRQYKLMTHLMNVIHRVEIWERNNMTIDLWGERFYGEGDGDYAKLDAVTLANHIIPIEIDQSVGTTKMCLMTRTVNKVLELNSELQDKIARSGNTPHNFEASHYSNLTETLIKYIRTREEQRTPNREVQSNLTQLTMLSQTKVLFDILNDLYGIGDYDQHERRVKIAAIGYATASTMIVDKLLTFRTGGNLEAITTNVLSVNANSKEPITISCHANGPNDIVVLFYQGTSLVFNLACRYI